MAEAKVKRKKMSEEEKRDWNELCVFVKKEILKYGDDTKFPRFLALRLKGLANGQYIVNNNQKLQGKYTFYEIKITFMYCKQDILYGFSKNVFVMALLGKFVVVMFGVVSFGVYAKDMRHNENLEKCDNMLNIITDKLSFYKLKKKGKIYVY